MTPAMAPSPTTVELASLSERAKEAAELKQRLFSVQQQVKHEELTSPPLAHTEGWDALQSAHAHMLLLEARLAELTS